MAEIGSKRDGTTEALVQALRAAFPAPAAFIAPLLVTEEQAASMLGVGLTKFNELRSEPFMPKPVELGPRAVRWVYSELQEAVAKLPRKLAASEPTQLSAVRANKPSGGRS